MCDNLWWQHTFKSFTLNTQAGHVLSPFGIFLSRGPRPGWHFRDLDGRAGYNGFVQQLVSGNRSHVRTTWMHFFFASVLTERSGKIYLRHYLRNRLSVSGAHIQDVMFKWAGVLLMMKGAAGWFIAKPHLLGGIYLLPFLFMQEHTLNL